MSNPEFWKNCIEEQRNKQNDIMIICPYCKSEQSIDTQQQFVSYWGQDSKKKIQCEECNKEFWVEESVSRTYETTTTEWQTQEDERFKQAVKEIMEEQKHAVDEDMGEPR